MTIDAETLFLAQERLRDKQRRLDARQLMWLLTRLPDEDLDALAGYYRQGDEEGMGGVLQDHLDLALWEAALEETLAEARASHDRRFDGGCHVYRMAANLWGCQVEWEERRLS